MQRFTLSRGTARKDPGAPGGHRLTLDGSLTMLTMLTMLTVFSEELLITLIAGWSFCGLGGDLLTMLTMLTIFSIEFMEIYSSQV